MNSYVQELKKYIQRRQVGTIIKKMAGWVSHRIDRALVRIFSIFPLRENMILFRSTSDFSDNARVFYDYLIDQRLNKDYKLIWLLNDSDPRDYFPPYNVKFVRFTAWHPVIRRDYYCAVAKCVIFTHGFEMAYSRPGQIHLHTSHSASQIKAALVDPSEMLQRKVRTSRDYSLACGPDGVMKKKISIGLNEDCLPIIGMPRLDLLYRENDCISNLITGYQGEQIILSMETFKQARHVVNSLNETDVYAINVVHTQEELKSLDTFLKNQNAILIVKIHPFQDLSFLQFVHLDNIRFFTNQDLDARGIQLYELVKNADILLTDYSSIFYDYLLLDRPIGFLLEDLNLYDKGFIDENPLKDMVGEKIYSLDDLENFIDEVNSGIDRFGEERKQLRDRVFTYQDGNNCKRLMEWMQEKNIIS